MGLSALALGYFVSQFFRSFIAVIAPELSSDLHASTAELGLLSSAFFFSSAAAQIPMGLAFDRIGVGRTVGFALLFGSLATLVLSGAHSLARAIIGQAALGIACAPLLIGMMHFVGYRYSNSRFVSIAGGCASFGLLGNLAAGAPFGWLVASIEWRGALASAALLTGAVGIFVLLTVQVKPVKDNRKLSGGVFDNIASVFSVPELRPLLPMCLVATGTALTFRSVWGGPYLGSVFGLGVVARGATLSTIGAGLLISSITGAVLGRFAAPRTLTLLWSFGAIVSLILLAAFPDVSPFISGGLLTLAAFFGSVHTFLMADGRRVLPEHLVGCGLGCLNFLVFAGIGSINLAIGELLQFAPIYLTESAQAYRLVFLILAVILTLASLYYRRLGATPNSTEHGTQP